MRTKPGMGLLTALLVVGLLLTAVPALAQDPPDTVAASDRADRAPKLTTYIQDLEQGTDRDRNVALVIKLQGVSLSATPQDRVVETLRQHAAATQKGVLEALDAMGIEVLNTFWLTNTILAEVPAERLRAVASLPGVETVFENFTITIPEPPELDERDVHPDTVGDVTWGLDRIGAPDVWDTLGITGAGVRVAVSDTGVDMTHPDLAGRMWTDDGADPTYPGGWIEFDGDGLIVMGSTPYDTDAHGTHCSGTVLGGDASGIHIGVAPDAILMHALVLPGGGGTWAQVIAGMQWKIEPFDQYGDAAGQRADVASMSWGGVGLQSEFIEPVENMIAAGVVPIAATGNEGPGTSRSPGNVYECFGIGATDSADMVWGFSSGQVIDDPSFHPEPYVKPDFSAPGVNVLSSVPGGYAYGSGTSMACPHVAGTVALMLQGNPGLTIPEIYEILKDTAVWYDTYYPDRPCTRYGWGRIDSFEAVSAATLESGIDGYVTDDDTGDPIEGAEVVVVDTGQLRYTDEWGYYRFYLPPGAYVVDASAFGYYPDAAVVGVVVDQFTEQDFALEPLTTGTIEGTVTDADTGDPIEDAEITLPGTPLSTTTGPTGQYSLEAPAGTYDVEARAWGYHPSTELDVPVPEAGTVTVDFALEPIDVVVAVLGDYNSQLTDLLIDHGFEAEERGWDVIVDIGNYDVVVVNLPTDPGPATFLNFLDAADAHGVGVVFTNQFYHAEPWGITLLQNHLGDPAGLGCDFWWGDVYYQVTQAHPILDGWDVGDEITIITGGWEDHAWFSGYSGDVIADLGTEYGAIQGQGVGVAEYGASTHVLLASLGPQLDTNMFNWTADARTIFINAVSFAAMLVDSGIAGYVTDDDTGNPIEGASVYCHETGTTRYTDGDGYYVFYLEPGTYTLTVDDFWYDEVTVDDIEVLEDQFTEQDLALTPLPTGDIAGTVSEAGTAATSSLLGAAGGSPIEGATITLLGTPASTTTDEFGHYNLEAPTGTYAVHISHPGYHGAVVEDVEVIEDQITDVNVALEPFMALILWNITADPAGWDALISGQRPVGGWDFDNDPDYGLQGFFGPLTSLGAGPVSPGILSDDVAMEGQELYDDDLVAVGPGSGFGNPSNAVLANYFVDSFEVHLDWDGSGPKSALEFDALSLVGSGTVDIYVDGEPLAAGVAAPPGGNRWGIFDPSGAGFIHVKLHDTAEGAEGVQGSGVTYVPDPVVTELILWNITADPAGWDALISGQQPVGGWDFDNDPDYGLQGFYGPLTSAGAGPVSPGILSDDVAMEAQELYDHDLAAIGPAAGFGNPSNAIVANYFGDRFEIHLDRDGSGPKSAIEFDAVSLMGSNMVNVYVDGDLLDVGVAAPPGGNRWGIFDPTGAGFVHVELYDTLDGAEGVQGSGVTYIPAPALPVAVLGDYESQLLELLISRGFMAEHRDWDIIGDVGDYAAVVINKPTDPGAETFIDFLDEADQYGVGVIFLNQRWFDHPWGIRLLRDHLNDPGDTGSFGGGDVFYRVLQEHPIFEGWSVGDEIVLIDDGPRDHGWFQDYTGEVIAELHTTEHGHWGDGVGLKEYGNSQHVLLASLGVGTYNGGHMDHWTEDARTVFINAVSWFATPSEGSRIHGTIYEVICAEMDGVTVRLYRDGVFQDETASDPDGNYTVWSTQTGVHELVASKEGFRSETRWVNVEDLEAEYEFNFAGNHGLIPDAPDLFYVLDCIDLWLYPSGDECDLTLFRVLDVIDAWLYD